MSRLEVALQNMQNYPKVVPMSGYPVIPLYADKDGMWYLYTIWHIEQAIKIMGV